MNSGEKINNDIGGNEAGWSELKELAKDDSVSDDKDVVVEKETPEERQEKIAQAAAKVREAYGKSDAEKPIPSREEIDSEEPLAEAQLSLMRGKKPSKYDIAERSRIDRIKSDLRPDNIDEYEMRQIASRPSAFTKTVRLVADKFGIKTKKSEERREREAMHVALGEYREKEAARKKAIEEREKAEALERERRDAERKAAEARREEEALARDMATARGVFDGNKHDKLKKQRIQEIVERDLNSRLLTVDDLEMEVNSENPEIQKRIVRWRKHDIPVYDLKGIPFSILSTTIDYRKANEAANNGEKNGVFSIGIDTYKKVMKNPFIWAERRDKAKKASGFGAINSDARGDTISTSYWNSERNIGTHVPGNLIYGFESVGADSIIQVDNNDGHTGNMDGGKETILSDPDAIKRLEGPGGTSLYNEVLLRRYTENGMPKKPDYIIVENGIITEESLRSAAYFGIPIINIDRSAYEEKAEKRGEGLLASISEDDTYEEMIGKIDELSTMSMYKRLSLKMRETIGDGNGMQVMSYMLPIDKRCIEVSRMEQLKRLDFIKSKLEEATRNIDSATEKGLPIEETPPGLEEFNIDIDDVQNGLVRDKNNDKKDPDIQIPASCNKINISFKLKNRSSRIKTVVYDGERVYKLEELPHSERIDTEREVKLSDSSFYDALEPVVLRYFEAIRKNRELMENST